MEKILSKIIDIYNSKKRIINILIYFIIISFIFCISLYLIYKKNYKSNENIVETIALVEKEETKEKEKSIKTSTIFVDIKGFVKNPGVYEIESDKRVKDVIKLAGGVLKNANTRYINLSASLKDEMVIVVYSNEEVEKLIEKQVIIKEVEIPCICESTINDACVSEKEENTNETNKLININLCSIEELMTLPGIGESKAKAIIEYRETNGNFEKIEDLLEVSGIGESIYDNIKDYITIK